MSVSWIFDFVIPMSVLEAAEGAAPAAPGNGQKKWAVAMTCQVCRPMVRPRLRPPGAELQSKTQPLKASKQGSLAV